MTPPTAGLAVDRLWILNDPAHYATLVLEQHWPEGDYQRWFGSQRCAALLDNLARPTPSIGKPVPATLVDTGR